MSKSRILKTLLTIFISFCLFFTISFMFSCKAVPDPEELWQAVKEGNIEEVENLLARGADVNLIDSDGNTAIINAEIGTISQNISRVPNM